LALLAAVFAQQSSDWVLPQDRDLYFPPFFKSEGFYRSFLINLGFAGISTAAAGIQFVKYTSFWMVRDPLLAIFLNLGIGLVAALCLRSQSTEISSRKRWGWALALLGVGAAVFLFAVWTTVSLGAHASSASPPATQPS